MAEPDDVVRERLAAVFARQDFYEACKRRDAGAMIRILGAHGITQGQMGARTGTRPEHPEQLQARQEPSRVGVYL